MRTEEQTKMAKANFLEALEKSLGIISTAAKKAKIDRSSIYRWIEDDPDFAAAIKDIDEIVLDFGESALHKQISIGVPTSTIFFLKTRGKKRGYFEYAETQSTNVNLNTELTEEEKEEAISRVKKGLDEFKDYE